MTANEQTIHNARMAWNALTQAERKIIVRWLALSPSRDLFCQIMIEDGNCPIKKLSMRRCIDEED